jgi:hypothetical protein
MPLRSHGNARDANEKEIVDAMRKMGASVYRLDKPVDLLVGFHNRSGTFTYLCEVKVGKKNLTAAQEKFISEWRGTVVVILRSVDDAIRLIRGDV